jgi:hypothetical protein
MPTGKIQSGARYAGKTVAAICTISHAATA